MLLRIMTEQDVPAGLRLNTLSGWNQTAADWQRFLRNSPRGCFVMEHDRTVVGTATTISYERRFAWIGMVLVDPEYRKQGIGTKLLEQTIEYLDQSQILTMKLDATPFGKPLYAKLGFVTEYEIERWILKRSPCGISTPLPSSDALPNPLELHQVFELDKELFGADRTTLLRSLHEQAPELTLVLWGNARPQAYALGRHGLFADHLGPWMAEGHEAAQRLLQLFLAQSSRETIIVDCLKSNSTVIGLLSAHGFTPSRPLTRMFRGPNDYPGRSDLFCAILGPEFG